ncbi:MAG: hypothetical protein AAF702_04545 [Chloroflexota bacterium]
MKTKEQLAEREELAKQSELTLTEFCNEHPAYSIDADQPEYRGGTNLITFGHRRTEEGQQQPIVFKYFIRTYRFSQEYFCLHHFADTGHVPKILAAVPDRLIVMTRYPASGIEAEQLNLVERKAVSSEMGKAVADWVRWPLPNAENWPTPQTEFEQLQWRTDMGEIIGHVLSLCRQIQAVVPSYQTPFYSEALALTEQHVDFIDQQPRVLFHEDFANLSVHQGHFLGFYDLEMVRIGTEAMQLGCALELVNPQWIDSEWLVWADFIQAFQETTRRTLDEADFLAILAMNHFYYHIRLCRWGKWNGNPAEIENMNFATSNAASYLTNIKRTCFSLREWVDLYKWFPSLR